jgi:hypothetical protein
VKHVRPWCLFAHLSPDDRDVHYRIPAIRGEASLTVFALETLVLVTAARIVGARSILEIGTSVGYNALHLAMNLPETLITTVDIQAAERVYRESEFGNRIQDWTGDSRRFPPRHFDMVFIDGDHSYATVEADTHLAFACSPLVTAWHDYGGRDGDDVCRLLDGHPLTDRMIHIEDTKTALWFRKELPL